MIWLKRGLLVVAVLLLLLVGAVAIFVATFDANSYKSQVTELVQERTGRELTLSGDIGLSVFPWLGLDVGAAALSNPPGFAEQPFAAVEAVRVHVALLPLLSREIRVAEVELRGLEVNLARDAQGRTNWEDLMQPQPGVEGEAAPSPEPGPQPSEPPPVIYVAGMQLVDARISWTDAQTGQALRIDPLNLRTGELEFGSPTPVKLDLRLIQEMPKREVALELKGDAVVDPKQGRYALSGLRLTTEASGEGIPGGSLEALLQGELAADLTAQTANARNLKLSAAGVEIEGELSVTGLTSEQRVKGRFETETFSPREVLDQLGIALPKTRDAAVFKQASAGFEVAATPNEASLSGLRLVLDDTQASGEAQVSNFAQPAIDFKLAVDAIDVDRYTPASGEAAAGGADQPPPGEPAPPLGLPVDLLRGLDLDGRIDVGRVKVRGLKLKDIEVTIAAHDGLVEIKPFRLALYGGRFKSDATVDVRGEKPAFGLRQDLFDVDFGNLLGDLTGDSLVSGKTKLSASLDTRGLSPKELLRQLDGDLNFAFTDGAVKGEGLAQAIQAVTGSTGALGAETTEFQSITGSARIDGGILKSRDLKLLAPAFEASGAGEVDLADELVDYTLRVGRAGKRAIPIRVAGSLDDLKFAPDLEAAAKEQAQDVLQKQLDKLGSGSDDAQGKPDADGDVKDALEEGLKGLFR
jgi:AsmA protein